MNDMIKKKIIILSAFDKGHLKKERTDTAFYLGEDISNAIDCVFLEFKDYKQIFGREKPQMSNSMKRLSVVRIKYGRKSIYRRYVGANDMKDSNQVALNPSSILELCEGERAANAVGNEVALTRGSKFMFYLHHPFHATRISTHLGIVATLLSLLSIMLTLLLRN